MEYRKTEVWAPGSRAAWELAPGEIHLWRAFLDRQPEEERELASLLSPEERERAARFVFARDRRRYVVGRAILRKVLSGYVGRPAMELAFVCGAHGKPSLRGHHLRFSKSASDGVALFGVSRDRGLGVDVERIRDLPGLDAVMGCCFSPSERAKLERLCDSARLEAFFTGWTRKEALAKATGLGLALSLDRAEVAAEPGPRGVVVTRLRLAAGESLWTIRDVAMGQSFAGAVAVEGWVGVPECRLGDFQEREGAGHERGS